MLILAACARPDSAGIDSGVRWQPASNDTIVFTLPKDETGKLSLYELRRELSQNAADPARAARFAKSALKIYAQTGDPRTLGYAGGALKTWQNVAAPPLDIWLLRGRLAQTEHRFADAAKDMDRLLTAYPGNAEALLLAADAWRRAGNLAAARGRCLTLSLSGHDALALLCAADVQLAQGQPGQAHDTAARSLARYGEELDAETLAFAHAIAAEAATASGDIDTALVSWQSAYSARSQLPLALRLGHVDTLLAAQQYAEALRALESLPEADAVLLRRAIAAGATEHPQFTPWRAELARRFQDPAYTEENSLHWRERAVFALDVMQEPETALELAQRNWAVQKGFEDAELVIRAARAAGDDAAVQSILAWRQKQGGSS